MGILYGRHVARLDKGDPPPKQNQVENRLVCPISLADLFGRVFRNLSAVEENFP